MNKLHTVPQRLEDMKRLTAEGVEYWLARELERVLEYVEWRNFEPVIERAKASCVSAGIDPSNHFVPTNELVGIGSGAERQVSDYALTREACYLITMNGNPNKRVIAEAQQYFVGKTMQMERLEQWAKDRFRVELRDKATEFNKKLAGTAKGSGVQNFGFFNDSGYIGLYEMRCSALKSHKGIPEKDTPLNHMGPEELSANMFRITQTDSILTRQGMIGEAAASETHRMVGQRIRETIKEVGGVLPEELPKAEPIQEVKKRLKSQERKLSKGANFKKS